jgi:MazG family protein
MGQASAQVPLLLMDSVPLAGGMTAGATSTPCVPNLSTSYVAHPRVQRPQARCAPYVRLGVIAPPKMKTDSTAGEKFQKLVAIMTRLRAPGGCPWDREQTFDSIKPYTLEETYEVLDAIDRRHWKDLAEELGDFLLQAVFYAQMGSEQGLFRIDDALDAINEKLVRRHPHVFGQESAESAGDVKRIWAEVKAAEKKDQGGEAAEAGLLSSVPRALPALVEAQQIASRAAAVGFDWENPEQVLDKLQEELAEFGEARRNGSPVQLADELGDLLFVLVNLARFVKVDPEQALRGTNAKFRERFGYIERKLAERGRKPQDSNIQEMEALWQDAKR